jgi:hypothetical protein
VQRAVPVLDERGDRGLVGQVERGDQNSLVAGTRDDVLGGAFARLQIADREGDLGASAGQS